MATNIVYTTFKVQKALNTMDLATDTLKLALFTSTYAPNQDTDATYSSLTGEVATGSGYTQGGVALTGVAVNQDNANHRMTLTCTNPSWNVSAVITYQTAVLYDSTITTDNVICYWDFGSNQQTGSNGTYTLQFTNGIVLTFT